MCDNDIDETDGDGDSDGDDVKRINVKFRHIIIDVDIDRSDISADCDDTTDVDDVFDGRREGDVDDGEDSRISYLREVDLVVEGTSRVHHLHGDDDDDCTDIGDPGDPHTDIMGISRYGSTRRHDAHNRPCRPGLLGGRRRKPRKGRKGRTKKAKVKGRPHSPAVHSPAGSPRPGKGKVVSKKNTPIATQQRCDPGYIRGYHGFIKFAEIFCIVAACISAACSTCKKGSHMKAFSVTSCVMLFISTLAVYIVMLLRSPEKCPFKCYCLLQTFAGFATCLYLADAIISLKLFADYKKTIAHDPRVTGRRTGRRGRKRADPGGLGGSLGDKPPGFGIMETLDPVPPKRRGRRSHSSPRGRSGRR
ncbi:hypothetical protein LSH36_1136g01044 [Paralvinella palmiformis]|uniref:MARVEL domain-containing protein n=1 Tax=Paralvinella palmiformis TaxID=53620 RepID=A0AAD9IUR2_9ANNE|nr:hypothetical protein LSH36_1136g01044 [Paralvinella palmiformis]